MASGFRARPPSFQPGMHLSDYYRVEGLIRLAEGRMFYLVDDHRPDRATRRCWECGNEENANTAEVCVECGGSLATRHFLLSSRWDRPGFEPFLGFFNKQISHPAMLAPCDVFPFPEESPVQVCSVVRAVAWRSGSTDWPLLEANASTVGTGPSPALRSSTSKASWPSAGRVMLRTQK